MYFWFCVFICYRFRGLNQFEEGRIVTKYVFRIVCSVRVCTENINQSALFCFLLFAFVCQSSFSFSFSFSYIRLFVVLSIPFSNSNLFSFVFFSILHLPSPSPITIMSVSTLISCSLCLIYSRL